MSGPVTSQTGTQDSSVPPWEWEYSPPADWPARSARTRTWHVSPSPWQRRVRLAKTLTLIAADFRHMPRPLQALVPSHPCSSQTLVRLSLLWSTPRELHFWCLCPLASAWVCRREAQAQNRMAGRGGLPSAPPLLP